MGKFIAILVVCFLALPFSPPYANADSISISGKLKILLGGSLVFPDGSVQNTATLQGPKGDKGDKGDTGATGPQGLQGPAASSFDQLNYYALGDSITQGTSQNYSYADFLNMNLSFKSLTKLAVSGATAMPSPGRGALAAQVDAVIANADIISILVGVTDYGLGNPVGDVDSVLSKPYDMLDTTLSFSEAFRYCLETIKRSHEHARIYVILPIQTTLIGPGEPLDKYRAAETKIAGYLSIPVIPANTESGLWAGGTYFPDGLHPNEAGHTMLANYLARKMSSL